METDDLPSRAKEVSREVPRRETVSSILICGMGLPTAVLLPDP